MSRDMLGSIPRALVRLPDQHQGLVLDVINKLSGKEDQSIHDRIAQALRPEKETKSPPELIRPSVQGGTYPHWSRGLAVPELEHVGPIAYYSNQIERFSHFRNSEADVTTGHYIFDALKRNQLLGRSLGLADAEAIAAKGDAYLRNWCGICELYFWRSVIQDGPEGNLFVPFIQCDDLAAGESPKWRSLDDPFGEYTCSAGFYDRTQ